MGISIASYNFLWLGKKLFKLVRNWRKKLVELINEKPLDPVGALREKVKNGKKLSIKNLLTE